MVWTFASTSKDVDLDLVAAEVAGCYQAFIWRDYLKQAIDRSQSHLDWAVMA